MLPFRIVGPAAVMMVTFRISVAREANGRYVLGKGSSFGVERPPSEGAVRTVSLVRAGAAGVGVVASCARPDAQAVLMRLTASTRTE